MYALFNTVSTLIIASSSDQVFNSIHNALAGEEFAEG
jgi:hypothetical protein